MTAKFFPSVSVFVAGAALWCSATSARADAIDDVVRARMTAKRVPGVSVVVLRDGKVVKSAGYGLANVETNTSATPDTVYQLASVTKQFTAVAVLQLVEAGKVRLEDTIPRFLTDCPEAWKPVTVRQLLNHTSGIPSYTSVPEFAKTLRKDYSPRELIGLVSDKPMDFVPGTRWSYNNTGYYLLGLLIEKVTGKSYGTHLNERIFSPLGMKATRVNDLRATIPNRAQGYEYTADGLRHGEYVSPTQPFSAGALVSTVADMAKWEAALDTETLLKRGTLAEAWSETRLADGKTEGYGYGFVVDKKSGHRRVHHGGGIPGFSASTLRLPDDKISVVVLTNLEGDAADVIAARIAGTFFPELLPEELKAIADPEPDLTKRLRGIVEGMAKGEAKEADFTPEMWRFLYPDRLKQGTKALGGLGSLAAFELVERKADSETRDLTYRAVFGTTSLTIKINLVGGKIAGIGFGPA
jgi:D-alanyl-D-alanine carboxypeptidase